MIVLDYQDRRPIYEQVTDKFQILNPERYSAAGVADAIGKAACYRAVCQS